MKKAIITGITGQDGAYLAQLLLDKGYDADILFWDIKSLDEVPYWFGGSKPRLSKVMKNGKVLTI